MTLRRLMYRWLLPAAVVLPAVLFLGWIVFSRDGWALLPTLLIFLPSVFIGQLVMALMVRSRASVRATRAVSWLDVAAFGVWHLLVLGVAWFSSPVFGLTLALAVIVGIATFWLTAWELWSEGRRAWATLTDTTPRATPFFPAEDGPRRTDTLGPTIVVQEAPTHDGGFGTPR